MLMQLSLIPHRPSHKCILLQICNQSSSVLLLLFLNSYNLLYFRCRANFSASGGTDESAIVCDALLKHGVNLINIFKLDAGAFGQYGLSQELTKKLVTALNAK